MRSTIILNTKLHYKRIQSVFEAEASVPALSVDGGLTVLAGTEDLLLASPVPSLDICMVKDTKCLTGR